jgi:hypothetical protein
MPISPFQYQAGRRQNPAGKSDNRAITLDFDRQLMR